MMRRIASLVSAVVLVSVTHFSQAFQPAVTPTVGIDNTLVGEWVWSMRTARIQLLLEADGRFLWYGTHNGRPYTLYKGHWRDQGDEVVLTRADADAATIRLKRDLLVSFNNAVLSEKEVFNLMRVETSTTLVAGALE